MNFATASPASNPAVVGYGPCCRTSGRHGSRRSPRGCESSAASGTFHIGFEMVPQYGRSEAAAKIALVSSAGRSQLIALNHHTTLMKSRLLGLRFAKHGRQFIVPLSGFGAGGDSDLFG